MLSFKEFLTLAESVGHGSEYEKVGELEHPTKGHYTIHKNDRFHHVYNQYNEVMGTFYNMNTGDVMDHLKEHEGMHELKESESAALNVHRGGYNEGMFAYHLNGGKWIDKDHQEETLKHKKHLDAYHSEEAKIQEDRAHAQVKSFLEHAHEKGYSGVKAIHLTAKPGDIEKKTGIPATQQDNPSDVVVHFKKHPKEVGHGYLGISLKSSQSKKIGFHNGGAGTIGKSLGVDLEGTAAKMQKSFMKKHNLGTVMSKAHAMIKGEGSAKRNNPMYSAALEHASTIHAKLRDMLHEKYSSMGHAEVKKHLLSTYIKASGESALPYVKTHGQGGGAKPAAAHTTDPSDNEEYHAIKNSKKIEFEKSGDSYIKVKADGKKVFGIQVKHNSGPLTSLKVLGQP